MMQVIYQQKQLPRFSKDFIGIGHQLSQKRKQRMKAQQQQRLMANRVIFLQNQQFRAQKSLQRKKMQLNEILKKSQRNSQQRQLKQKMLMQRQKDLQMTRQQNRLKRLLHRQSIDYSNHIINSRNSLDYKIGRSKLQQGEERKKMQMRDQLTYRQERYMTLNVQKQQGRSRIDKFYKDKNKQHTMQYKQKIHHQQNTTRLKFNTIKKLGQIEEALRKKLQQSSQKVSLMNNLIGSASNRFMRSSLSKTSLDNAQSQHNSGQVTSMQEDVILKDPSKRSLLKDSSKSSLNSLKNIFGSQLGKVQGHKVHRKRSRKNSKFSQYITS